MRSTVLVPCLFALVGCGSGSSADGNASVQGCNGQDLFTSSKLDWLIGTWDAAGGGGDHLVFSRSPRQFSEEITRQVGSKDTPSVPFPTVCRYQHVSDSFCVVPYSSGGASTPYAIHYLVENAVLVDVPGNDAACGSFMADQQSKASHGTLQYTLRFGQNADGSLNVDGTTLTLTP